MISIEFEGVGGGELDEVASVTESLGSLTIRDMDVDPVLKVGCTVVEGR